MDQTKTILMGIDLSLCITQLSWSGVEDKVD